MVHQYLAGKLQVDRITIPVKGLASALADTRIVQLSDFHFDGLRLSTSLLEEAIQASNRFNPHLVVLTGDFVTDDPHPIYALAEYLQGMRSQAGIYAVLGNHDHEQPGSQYMITEALSRFGVVVLQNDVVYPLGKELAVVGLGDYWAQEFYPQRVLPALPPTLPRIVLSHNPDTAAVLRRWRVDLQLSGHTHGGQVVLPKIGPIISHARRVRLSMPAALRKLLWHQTSEVVKHWKWAQGLHPVGENLLYVNRGLGTYLPGRLNCPPEVTCITLVPAVSKESHAQGEERTLSHAYR